MSLLEDQGFFDFCDGLFVPQNSCSFVIVSGVIDLLFNEADLIYRGMLPTLLHMVPKIHHGQQIFMANPFEMFNE